MSLPFMVAGPFWRAVFVAGVALVLFVLVRCWRSLEGQPARIRLMLVSLRGAGLLLLLCAVVGMRVGYESNVRSKVLLRRAFDVRQDVREPNRDSRVPDQFARQTMSALKEKGIEGVEMADAGERSVTEENEFSAALLLTDGAMRVEEARREVERASAAGGGVPVYVSMLMSRPDEPAVALESATPLSAAMRGVPMNLRAVVHGRGMRGRESLLTVADDAKVQASANVRWTSDDEWQTVALEVVPKVAGWTNYTVRVEAARDESQAMLSRAVTVFAEERRLRVLLFEGEPTWESKFIRRALAQSGIFDVDYFAQVSRAATVGAVGRAEGGERKAGGGEGGEAEGERAQATGADAKREGKHEAAPEARLHAALASEALVNSYDCIIVGATPDAMLSAAEASRLKVWVERRGGGLIILGGNSFAGSIAAPRGKLNSLLPAEVDQRGFASQAQQVARGGPVETEKTRASIALLPTVAGADSALGGYLRTSEGVAKLDALTGQGLRLGALNPGATVLAVGAQSGLVSVSDRGVPLVAAMRDGAGRALVFAPSDSWRLRTSATDAEDQTGGPFGALWQGLVLWSAAGARAPVEIVLNDGSPAAGDEVTAEISVRDEGFAPLKIEKLRARLHTLPDSAGAAVNDKQAQEGSDGQTQETSEGQPATGDGQTREIVFLPDSADASVWRARFIAPSRGRFSLEADYIAGGKSGNVWKYFAVVQSSSLEAGAARDTLSRLARETGGELFAVTDTADALAARLSALPQHSESIRRELDLRTYAPLAFIIPLLLSIEWLVRRWRLNQRQDMTRRERSNA